jgi:hypothetical protein
MGDANAVRLPWRGDSQFDQKPMSSNLRKYAIPLGFLAIALPVGIWAITAMGDPESAEKAADKAAFRSVSTTATRHDDRRAEARWERVTTLSGKGSADKSFAIEKGAIQWRAKWLCRSGRFEMSIGRGDANGKTVADRACPDTGKQVQTGDGQGMVHIKASGAWRVVVEQQVDTALKEPPLKQMTKETLLARGRFYRIQKRGEGSISLFRLPNGRLALRYTKFYTAPSPGLEVWLSTSNKPHSTLDARRASHVNAGGMRSTFGSYNEILPARANAEQIRSVIIWCPTVMIAFGAASFG